MARGITPAMVGSAAKKNPATPREQVMRWAQGMGLRASSGKGWVSISDKRSDWSETFDTWADAMKWARDAYDAHRDESKPWPWDVQKNPAKKTTKRSKAQNLAIALSEQRAGHPRKAREYFKAAAKANPSAMLYVVHRADAQGKPVYDIAKFRKKTEALQYAKAYAKSYGVPVVLTGKKL